MDKFIINENEQLVCCGKCCGDCLYMDLNDKDKYGDYYCGKKREYYPASDNTCGEFEWK